jgi:hypothetical protein
MQNLPFAAQQEQVNKFLQTNRVLGAQMDQQQGTTQIIYDTQTFTGVTSYDFFSEVTSKQTTTLASSPATNISDNRFQPGEGMVIKEIVVSNLFETLANVANIQRYMSLGLINIYVGNNRVIKDLPIFSGNNIGAINNLPISNTNSNVISRNAAVRLFTNIVIPPQIQFYVNVRLPIAPSNAAGSDAILRVTLKGYGKLFNPRNNY